MKAKFKRMRNRSLKFFALDVTQDYQAMDKYQESPYRRLPNFVLFPAYHKTTHQHKFEPDQGNDNALAMGEFILKHADVKFSLNNMYFRQEKKNKSKDVPLDLGKKADGV